MSWYQKGKTNLDFTEPRDSEWQWNPLDHMQVCTSLQTDNHASTPPLFCTGRMPFLPPNQQRQSTKGIAKIRKNEHKQTMTSHFNKRLNTETAWHAMPVIILSTGQTEGITPRWWCRPKNRHVGHLKQQTENTIYTIIVNENSQIITKQQKTCKHITGSSNIITAKLHVQSTQTHIPQTL